jgi:hypothetical protein
LTSAADSESDEFDASVYFDLSENFSLKTGIGFSWWTVPFRGQRLALVMRRLFERKVRSEPGGFPNPRSSYKHEHREILQSFRVNDHRSLSSNDSLAIPAALLLLSPVVSLLSFIQARRKKTDEFYSESEDLGIPPIEIPEFTAISANHEFGMQ